MSNCFRSPDPPPSAVSPTPSVTGDASPATASPATASGGGGSGSGTASPRTSVGGCGTSCNITSSTDAPTPSDHARTRVGVGESVTLTFTPGSAAWSVDQGGTLSGTSGPSVTFTAGDRTATATITAAGSACSCSKVFTVVEPSGNLMRQVPGTNVKHEAGKISAGFLAEIYVLPADVSFRNIVRRETDTTAVANGQFAVVNGMHHDTRPNIPFRPVSDVVEGLGSRTSTTDQVYIAVVPHGSPPFATGRAEVDIPNEFKVGSGTPKVYTAAPGIVQLHVSDEAGLCTTSKGGESKSAALDAATVDFR